MLSRISRQKSKKYHCKFEFRLLKIVGNASRFIKAQYISDNKFISVDAA